MFVYRIAHPKYKEFTLSGVGAEKVGGRWNEVGTRAVYCSENMALALLEYYIHSVDISLLPKEILIAKIYIPDSFTIDELSFLPDQWYQYPYQTNTTQIFTKFAKNPDFFGLKVPSAIVGLEHNYILNPLYKDFGKVEVKELIHLPIDNRLRGK